MLNDIYMQKIKFDRSCRDQNQPRLTMEQYLYTYLNHRYGLHNLAVEYFQSILNAVVKHKDEDHEIVLFGKILKNECDEEFRQSQVHVTNTLNKLMRQLLQERNKFMDKSTQDSVIEQIKAGQIEMWMWTKILERMYDVNDRQKLVERISSIIQGNAHLTMFDSVTTTPISLNDIDRLKNGKLLYSKFLKVVLDFQLSEHCEFLHEFIDLYKQVDKAGYGVLDEQQFLELVDKMIARCKLEESKVQESDFNFELLQ